MNCTFARNKAATNAVIYNHNGKSKLTNTLIWGNKSDNYDTSTDAAEMQISHSASDYDYGGKFSTGTGNVVLDEDNSGTNGPRFTRPSTTAGVEGNDATNLWNPVAISIATDGGDGVIPADNTGESGAYKTWFDTNLSDYADQ